ncbi:hypothetical protein BH20ACT9_BH20ACT9_18300 [soil metagenome]
MGAETRYLTYNEEVVRTVRRHPSVLLPSAALAVAVVVAAFLLSPTYGGDWISGAMWWLALLAVLRLVWRSAHWWHDRITVTDRRIFETSGIFTRRIATMPLRQVTDLTFRRSLFGRAFGYGEFVLETAGQHQAFESIRFLPNPDDFYRTVMWLVFGRE